MTIADKIKSIREGVGISFVRPDVAKMKEYQEALRQNQDALNYLKEERGLSIGTINHFKLGYDSTRHAISIPIMKNNELVNIKYRLLKPRDFKYSSERNAESWVFNEDGLDIGKTKGSVLVVEGEFDCMVAWQSGVKNVISPSSGKDSYGLWIERLDTIPKIYIAYDTDQPGKKASLRLAERLGVEKCMELIYTNSKDASEYFRKYTIDNFRELWKNAKPFYLYKYKGIGEIIHELRYEKDDSLKIKFLPGVKVGRDWLIVVTGVTNSGKTSWSLNVADDLTKGKIPVLIMPFERGIGSIGKRFLQVKFDKTSEDFALLGDSEWEVITNECINLPTYFSLPNKNEVNKTIIDAKRLFGVEVVIIDHLDYLIRHSQNREAEISNTLQDLKRLAEEHQIVMIIITHVRKITPAGSQLSKKPNLDDVKGSSSLSQDPECVVILSHDVQAEQMEVEIAKNKGEMRNQFFAFNVATGKLKDEMEF